MADNDSTQDTAQTDVATPPATPTPKAGQTVVPASDLMAVKRLLETKEGEVKALQTELDHRQSLVSQAEAAKADLEAKLAEANTATTELARLQAELATATTGREQLQKQLLDQTVGTMSTQYNIPKEKLSGKSLEELRVLAEGLTLVGIRPRAPIDLGAGAGGGGVPLTEDQRIDQNIARAMEGRGKVAPTTPIR